MDVTAIRTILVYLIKPEDTSAGRQSQNRLAGNLPAQKLRRLDMIKSCSWFCLAMIVSFAISSFR